MKLNKILTLTVLFLPALLIGQSHSWNNLVSSGSTFNEIQNVALVHFDSVGKGRGTGYKQFMRWSIEAKAHLESGGKVINYAAANYKANEKLSKALSQNAMRSTNGIWDSRGPFDYSDPFSSGAALGRTSRIAFHPTSSSTFLVGTAVGGLWKTTDAGATWTPQTDGMPNLGTSGIVYDYNNPQVMYLLTGDGDARDIPSMGVLKSTNGGTHWMPTGLTWNESVIQYPFSLVMDPSNPNILLVGTNQGIWRTLNGGNTWAQTWFSNVWDIEFAADASGDVYAASDLSFLKSTNSGGSWTINGDSSFPNDSLYERMAIAVSPSVPANVYALFGGDIGTSGLFHGVFKSTDFGETFAQQANSPNILGWETDGTDTEDQASKNLNIVVDPLNDNIVYTGAINVWKSINGGVTWTAKTDWQRINPGLPWIHADQLDLKFHEGSLYVCADGGLYETGNGGNDWTELSAGLAITQYYYIDVLNNDFTGGSQDNGTSSNSTNDINTTIIFSGDGFGCMYHYGNTSITYLSTQHKKIRRQGGVVTNITPAGLTDFWEADMDMHTTNPDYIFVGHTELYRGDGDIFGFSWDPLNTNFAVNRRITSITQGVDDPSKMYISNDVEMLKTNNIDAATVSWNVVPRPSGVTGLVLDMVVDPDDYQRMWVCFSGYQGGQKIYFTPNGGSTWINMTGTLPNVPAHCLLYESGSNDGVYVGTDLGVFYRNASMTDWLYFSNGMPSVIVKDLDTDNGFLYAGSFGRGLWRTPLYSSCSANLTLTTANDPSSPISTGRQVHYALNSITSSRIITGGIGTDVIYNAGTSIAMLPGFWAKTGNIMEAIIAGCPD